MIASSLLALAATISSASAVVYKGFNYDAAANFEADFNTAKNLAGTSGFTSARLYTMIAPGTTNTPTGAIQAAIDTQTTLLCGLWAAEDQAAFDNEKAALSAAISQYGTAFTSLIAGVSVGSEDLYRLTSLGAPGGAGQSVGTLVSYINQVKTLLSDAGVTTPVGHVDTYTAWVNASNVDVLNACDFLGTDAYPYYETTKSNSIANANATFWGDYSATAAVANGKPIWITETGWPVSGPDSNEAVASVANAEAYWASVGCSLFDNVNTWWYTLSDAPQPSGTPSFGITGQDLSTTPLYSLTC